MSKEDIVYWTTRRGEKIDIDKMSISHLCNTVKMVTKGDIDVNNTSVSHLREILKMVVLKKDCTESCEIEKRLEHLTRYEGFDRYK